MVGRRTALPGAGLRAHALPEAAGGQDIRIGGGASVVRDFLKADLVDFFLFGPGRAVLPAFQGSFNLAYPPNAPFPDEF